MKFNSVKEIEEYMKNIIGIPYVNLEGIDIKVCNEIVRSLGDIFSLYPLLKNSIVTIGPTKDIVGQINLINFTKDMQTNCDTQNIIWHEFFNDKETEFLTENHINDKDNSISYIALRIGPMLYNNDLFSINFAHTYNAILKNSPSNCRTLRSTIYHEMGHVLDCVLRITQKPEFLELLRSINIEEDISIYATLNERETFAEAFAEYHSTSEPNEAVTKIVEFALEEYRKRAEKKSEIFNVSRKFR